jgi:hypothetical protein
MRVNDCVRPTVHAGLMALIYLIMLHYLM